MTHKNDKLSENAENVSATHDASCESSPTPPKISVIVPVYKAEKFLAECIESVLAQTFADFELVLVDDGSPDNSGKICDDFATRDSRIRVFHKENGGVSSARKLGLENARGEWITFVDADDKLLAPALEILLKTSQKFPDADLVEGELVRDELYSPGYVADSDSAKTLCATGLEYALEMAKNTEDVFYTYCAAKIIRRSVLISANALDAPAWIVWAEDFLMCLRLASKIKSAVKIFQAIYFYRVNPESASVCFRISPKYCREFLRETERSIPGGLDGKFAPAWRSHARSVFVPTYMSKGEWDCRDEYWKKVTKEISKEPSELTFGARLCVLSANCPPPPPTNFSKSATTHGAYKMYN